MPSMPQPAQPDHNTSATEEVILGVDTHKDNHVAAVITGLGAVAASRSFPTTMTGYHQLLAWARTFGMDRERPWLSVVHRSHVAPVWPRSSSPSLPVE